MKKLISRLLPAVLGMMVLSASTAFAQVNADAKAVYDDMEAKSMNMTEANMYCHMNMNMSSGAETLAMGMDMNMLIKNMNQPDSMQYLCKNIITLGEQKEESVMWYNDGYSYTDAGGQKMKLKMNTGETMKSALDLSAALGSSSDILSDLTLTTEGDVRTLHYTMDDAKMNHYMNQLLTTSGLDQMLTQTGIQMKLYDIKGSYVLTPDNNYSSAIISMGMDVTAGGETIKVVIEGFISILNPGQPVQFELPDPAGYTEFVPGQNAA